MRPSVRTFVCSPLDPNVWWKSLEPCACLAAYVCHRSRSVSLFKNVSVQVPVSFEMCLSASKVALEPGAHAVEHRLCAVERPALAGRQLVVAAVEQQPHAR